MADKEQRETETGDFVDEPEVAAESAMAVSAMGALAPRVEGIAQMYVDHPNREALTNLFDRSEPTLWAKAIYRLEFSKAIGAMDDILTDKDGQVLRDASGDPVRRGFANPDFYTSLMRPLLNLRTSVKERTRIHLRDITKIFQREGDTGRHGFFTRR